MTLRKEMSGASTAAGVKTEWSWPSHQESQSQSQDKKSPHAYNKRPFRRISHSPPSALPPETQQTQPLHPQPINFNFFNFQSPFGGQDIEPSMNQNDHVDGWMPQFAPAGIPRFINHDNGLQLQQGLSVQVSENGFGLSWDVPGVPPTTAAAMNPETHEAYAADHQESRGSFSSVAFSTPNTAASSMSDGWVFPVASPQYGSPGSKELIDLNMTDDHVNTGQAFENSYFPFGKPSSPISSDDFSFDGDAVTNIDWNMIGPFGTETVQWSPPGPVPRAQTHQPLAPEPYSQLPWSSPENAQASMHSTCIAFERPHNAPHHAYRHQDETFAETLPAHQQLEAKPVVASREKEVEWEEIRVPSYAHSYSSHSRSPPISQNTPSQTSSPPQNSPSPPNHNDNHSHIFSAFPGPPKRKPQRGRVRPLTNQEKRNAREVRLAGACWACHLSKIRCSPCSPGAPCEQCTRLSGKRRFCRLPCFNDPLEALNTFLVPDYLMGHFTRANVETFVTRNASSWGTESFLVHMTWGFQRPLKASVVTLTMSSPNSEIGFRHRALTKGQRPAELSRQESPPIGIPLAAMIDLEADYASYVKDIVMNDLDYYAEMAYADEESYVPELLLKAVCDFYTTGLEAEDECDLLRQAIEIHVTCTILERSLILDEESRCMVENNLGRRYPERSAPRCAQRQIKLALFNVQRQRIISVLAKWGSLMWTSNTGTSNERKWAIGFSVFLVLTLIIDKTLGAAHLFCENRIENHGCAADIERSKFRELNRLTETELFERCKEILHSRFKTRKAGKESCNPIRDGNAAWRGKAVDEKTERFVEDLQAVVGEFNEEIRSHRSVLPEGSEDMEYSPHQDAGRLACILLDDCLDHRE